MNDHILIVDDDPHIGKLVAECLAEFGFRVSRAIDGSGMDQILESERVDLLVLDVRLPGEDGLTLMRRLRGRSAVPIILLTTRSDEVDRILGLELGADDYVTKPFSPRELLARVRAVLRRTQSKPLDTVDDAPPALRFSGWELDARSGRLSSPSGERVLLTQAEGRLLHAFLKAPRRTLTRDQLLDLSRAHNDDVFDRSIDVQILRLRRKLEVDPSRPKLIKTDRGVGYFLDAKVEAVGGKEQLHDR
ncbi:MAG: response regulator [Burkholderiales bacterium]|nr:response regulator [Burkholderiales bacterium]